MDNNFTADQLYTEGWKKGNTIYIDGNRIDARTLRGQADTYQFVKEEQKNAISRNIYFKTKTAQASLWTRQ